MSFTVIIPARYASTRLPGKPLLKIADKPMIQLVYEQALKSKASRVIIATDDERILEASKDFGAEVCLTSSNHPSGSDRLEEVTRQLKMDSEEVVVNVQGDEPMIPPVLIDQVAHNLLEHSSAGVSTLCEQIGDVETIFNPNAVKVVFDHQGYANYFSRAPIPWSRGDFGSEESRLPKGQRYYRHIGIYAYRVNFLRQYVSWPPSQVEQTECLEQLRALSNGVKIHIDTSAEPLPAGVDTESDLQRLRDQFSSIDTTISKG